MSSQVCLSQQQATEMSANVPSNKDCCTSPAFTLSAPSPTSFAFNPNNTLSFTQSLNIATNTTKKIVSIAADLNYFEFTPGSDDCSPCNKNSETFGNFSSGSIGSVGALGAGTHVVTSTFSAPKQSGNFPASLTITLPPLVQCCEGFVRWCVRYVITFDDCTVCTKVICYDKKKPSATVVNHQPNNQN